MYGVGGPRRHACGAKIPPCIILLTPIQREHSSNPIKIFAQWNHPRRIFSQRRGRKRKDERITSFRLFPLARNLPAASSRPVPVGRRNVQTQQETAAQLETVKHADATQCWDQGLSACCTLPIGLRRCASTRRMGKPSSTGPSRACLVLGARNFHGGALSPSRGGRRVCSGVGKVRHWPGAGGSL